MMRKWKSIMMVFKEITFYHDLCMKSKPYLLYILYMESNIFCKYYVFYMQNQKRNFSVFYVRNQKTRIHKFIIPISILYLMYGIKKTYLFSTLQIPYKSRTLCTESKNVPFQCL